MNVLARSSESVACICLVLAPEQACKLHRRLPPLWAEFILMHACCPTIVDFFCMAYVLFISTLHDPRCPGMLFTTDPMHSGGRLQRSIVWLRSRLSFAVTLSGRGRWQQSGSCGARLRPPPSSLCALKLRANALAGGLTHVECELDL